MFNKEKVVSFDVDAQKGFTPLCPNELPVPGGHEIVAELNAQARFACRRIGSKDAHPQRPVWLTEDPKEIGKFLHGYPNATHKWPAHCVVGTKGFELLDGLPKPEEYDFFVWKGMEPDIHPYGACWHDLACTMSTGVLEYLRVIKPECVVVGGLATDYCVAETCRQLKAGLDGNTAVILNLGACRAIDDKSAQMTLRKLKEECSYFYTVDSAAALSGRIKK